MTSDNQVRDKVISIVRTKGPLLPFKIAKEINTNILMASAHLSELSAKNIVKISSIKVGGSPLYYAPGQESKLQNFSENLGEKEYRAYQLLQEKKILEDRSLPPVVRVALRDIKDFAVPLKVTHNSKLYIFWKWYLSPNEEVEPLIGKFLQNIAPAAASEAQNTTQQPTKQPEPQVQQAPTQIQQTQPNVQTEPQQVQQQTITPSEPEIKEPEPKPAPKKQETKLDLTKLIEDFFTKNRIKVLSSDIKKKNNEIDYIIEVPSNLGNLVYYCKAKNKKKINNTDLTNTLVAAQMKKMPAMFLTPGELSKKAAELLETELRGLTFKKIE